MLNILTHDGRGGHRLFPRTAQYARCLAFLLNFDRLPPSHGDYNGPHCLNQRFKKAEKISTFLYRVTSFQHKAKVICCYIPTYSHHVTMKFRFFDPTTSNVGTEKLLLEPRIQGEVEVGSLKVLRGELLFFKKSSHLRTKSRVCVMVGISL